MLHALLFRRLFKEKASLFESTVADCGLFSFYSSAFGRCLPLLARWAGPLLSVGVKLLGQIPCSGY